MMVQIFEWIRQWNYFVSSEHFPWDQKWQDYKVEEDFFFAREQYTRVPLLYLEVEELYEKGGRYRFDMCICLHCSIQKESWNKMSFVSEEPIKRFKKSCVSNMSWKEIILFHSVQGKNFLFFHQTNFLKIER